MSRISEWWNGRHARDRVIFTGKRRHLTSMEVRGEQVAEELDGICVRSRHLSPQTVASAPGMIWVVEPDMELVSRFDGLTPQFFDPINPRIDPSGDFERMNQAFRYLILNTSNTIEWLGREPDIGWKSWVIPHHHCNMTGYRLPQDRLEKPRTVGYLGQADHLHDADVIEAAVSKMGLEFRTFDARDLGGYKEIDIGIAWTRRDALRDQTRSNIKLANFAAHGVPSVVCDYESYRSVNEATGGVALIRSSLDEFIEGVRELSENEEMRRQLNASADVADQKYSRHAIGELYHKALSEARLDWELQRS
jgi:hypothetical protein